MFSFNTGTATLTINKIPIKKKSNVYKELDSYRAYKKYLDEIVCQQVSELLIDALNEKWTEGRDCVPKLWAENVRIRRDTTSTYKGYEYNSVFVTLRTPHYIDNTKEFCIMKIPVMDKYGLITKEGKKYALLNSLVQDNDITYGGEELKLMTKKRYLNIKKTKTTPKMVLNKKNTDIFELIFALALEEGLDCERVLARFARSEVAEVFINPDKLTEYIAFKAPEHIEKGVVQDFMGPNYDLSLVREKMNKTLSLDRALGKVLSREIKLNNGEVLEIDTTLTSIMLKKIKHSKINEIYVQDIPNMVGYYLAESIPMVALRKGTQMISAVQEYIPEYTGMYLDRDILCTEEESELFVIPYGTLVEPGLLEVLQYNGVTSVELSETIGGVVKKLVTFEKEILGNRHFRRCEIESSTDQTYVYVNEDGEIEPAKTNITSYDLTAMLSLFYDLVKGENTDVIAGRDVGFRKRVNQADVLFTQAFEKAAPKFVKQFQRKLKDKIEKEPDIVTNADYLEAEFFKLTDMWWHELYTEMRVVQIPDTANPCSFYSSLNKIVTIVQDSNAISLSMRQMNMGHYGKLCPFETPSSRKLGVVTNKAICAEIIDGILFTPYYRVMHNGNDAYITDEIVWMNAEHEESYRIADITSLRFNDEGKIRNTNRVLARIPAYSGIEKVIFAPIDIKYVEFVNVDPNQTLSHVCQTIPLLGGDDSARATFAASMAKQAKCLIDPDIPTVSTSGNYELIRESPYFQINAEYDGYVIDYTDSSITIQYDGIDEAVTYDFEGTEYSTYSVITRYIVVREGDRVQAGQTLVSSNYVKDGVMALGVDLLVAFIPKGYNYEDGVHLSKRGKYRLTSYGSSHESVDIPKKVKSPAIGHCNNFRYVKPGMLVYKYKAHTDTGYIEKYVFADKMKGFLINVTTDIDKYSSNKRVKAITAHSVSLDILSGGDKIANRHGNKGVVPTTRPNTEMEVLRNGEYIDVCYNPAGVSSRMNLGQILEAHLGLACHVLGIKVRSDSYNGATKGDIQLLLSYAWHLANDDDVEKVMKDYSMLPRELHDHCRRNMRWIRHWKNVFNEDGTAWLYNPLFGKEYPVPVLIGVNHIYKLAQESSKKEHARAGYLSEPYVEKTDAPTKGASEKGGQRLGTMEIDALSAYGTSALIQECMNERGDNGIKRNNLHVSAAHKGDKYILDERNSIRRSTEFFVNAFEALGLVTEFEGELPNNTKEECAKRGYYAPSKIISATDSKIVDSAEQQEIESDSFNQFSAELGQ